MIEKQLTFGILIPTLDYNSSLQIAGSIQSAKNLGIKINIFPGEILNTPENFYAQANIIYDFISEEKIDGIIVWTGGLNWFLSKEQTSAFLSKYKPIPMISLEVAVDGIPSILMDDCQGMKDAVSHIIEVHGCKKIAFLRGMEGHLGARERYRGYAEALKEHDIEIDDAIISPENMTWYNPESIKILLDERKVVFEAVAMANTGYLFETMNYLESKNIKIPRDCAIVGFDNNPVTEVIQSPLTIVEPPFYRMGQRAVELLAEKIKGNPVPDIENIKPGLIIRRSCGCFSKSFIKAEVHKENNSQLFQNDESIFTMLDEGIKKSIGKTIYEINRDGRDILYEAFLSQVMNENDNNFFFILEDLLDKTVSDMGDVNAWQDVLSTVRIKSINYTGSHKLNSKNIENICNQSRIMISEAAHYDKLKRNIQDGVLVSQVNSICQKLMIDFNMDAIMDVVVAEFPKLNINSCYISIYKNPDKPSEDSLLIMAYNENGRINVKPGGLSFPTNRIIPDDISSKDDVTDLFVMDLYFQKEQIGFIVFGDGVKDMRIYETLRGTISSSLKGALLVRQINDHVEQLSKSNSKLDKSNKKLKENEKKLSASEKRASNEAYLLNILLDAAPDYIFVKDSKSRFIRCNQSLAQLMGGKSAKDLLGKTDFDFYPKELAEKYYADEQAIFQTGKPIVNREEPNIDPEGNYTCYLMTKVPMRDKKGNIIGLLGISRDITDIKITEEATRERNLLRTLIDNLPDHIYAKDIESRFTLVNEAVAKHMGGKKPEDLLGKTDFDFYKSELAEKFHADEKMLFQSGQPILNHEEFNRDPVGNIVRTLTTKIVLYDSQGKAFGLIGIGRDITEIKAAQEKLENAYKSLKENQEKLKLYSDKLEISNAELEQFAHIASHDLREPLRKINAFGEMLKKKYYTNLEEVGRDYVDRMQNATVRMQALIDNLLTYSRVTTQAKPYTSMDLDQVVKDVLSDLELQIRKTSGRVDADSLPAIEADPIQMRQLFQNLVANGLKFHKPDEPPVIKVYALKEAPEGYCMLTVEDNGIGIDETDYDKLFKMFGRLHEKTEYEGSGIGLAICKKIVERHGGSIRVESKANVGTKFIVTLPSTDVFRKSGEI